MNDLLMTRSDVISTEPFWVCLARLHSHLLRANSKVLNNQQWLMLNVEQWLQASFVDTKLHALHGCKCV